MQVVYVTLQPPAPLQDLKVIPHSCTAYIIQKL